MTENELSETKKKLPCEFLRQFGKPREFITWKEMVEYWEWKEAQDKHEEKQIKKLLEEHEYPDLTEDEYVDFIYLRACLYTGVKPMGDFEGIARICAEVMRNGGDIVDMHRAGANPVYCVCLSAFGLDDELQKEIIDNHIPF